MRRCRPAASLTVFTRASGGMADALASGASVRKDVGVQVPSRPPRVIARFGAIPSSLNGSEQRNCVQLGNGGGGSSRRLTRIPVPSYMSLGVRLAGVRPALNDLPARSMKARNSCSRASRQQISTPDCGVWRAPLTAW